MTRGGAYEVIFGPSPPGVLGGAGVLGFRAVGGRGEPSPRRRLARAEREEKRRRNKARRRAVRRGRS